LAPPERVDLHAGFEPRRFGEGVQVYFESVESLHDDITPGVEKRVVWRDGFYERRTPVSVLYVHGFSATSEEIRPLPDLVAGALGANLVYTRLRGHGRGGAALGEVTASDWVADMAEGLAAARAVGERVVVIATSTGGTLATAAALDPEMREGIAALVMLSPNYAINDPNAWLLTLPGARLLLPFALGEERRFEPANAAQARYWT
ncbi:alpha/beta hydrolase, partial [Cribrihabitans sp. XS_ASV171]